MSSYIALDIGEKRIGVAVCDAAVPFPAPLTTLLASPQLATQIAVLLQTHKVVGVVVGYPRNQQGEPTAQTQRVEHIVRLLGIPADVPVYFQDESLTSVKAETELKRRKKPYHKADVDALAATFILEDFIQQQLPSVRTQKKVAIGGAPAKAVHQKRSKKKRSQEKKHSKKSLSLVFRAIATLTAIGAMVIFGVFAWYGKNIRAASDQTNYQVVTIAPGSTTENIAATLEEKQLIRSKTAFLLYTRLQQKAALQAGSYRLSPHLAVSEIVNAMAGGKVSTVKVLIAPGLRVDQIVNKLLEYGYEEQEVLAAMDAVRDHPLLKDISGGDPLEGYIFPDTYQIAPDTTAEQLLRTTFDTFQNRLSQEPTIAQGLVRQGLSFVDAVTIASIVQMEVPDYETQQKVAQVFLKRYKEGMPLGADPTFKYAAAMTGQAALPSIDSPYNTRKYSGLPPTAIANFNMSALRAVANPSPTDYVYFVSGDDGITRFSRTFDEHQQLINQYCIQLCR